MSWHYNAALLTADVPEAESTRMLRHEGVLRIEEVLRAVKLHPAAPFCCSVLAEVEDTPLHGRLLLLFAF